MPDGQGFAATAARRNGDKNWWVAKLVAIDRKTGISRITQLEAGAHDLARFEFEL